MVVPTTFSRARTTPGTFSMMTTSAPVATAMAGTVPRGDVEALGDVRPVVEVPGAGPSRHTVVDDEQLAAVRHRTLDRRPATRARRARARRRSHRLPSPHR